VSGRFRAALVLAALAGALGAADPRSASCIACHGQLDGVLAQPATAWAADVHLAAGLGCVDCHGGDPAPGVGDDGDAAMSPAKGFRPKPDRLHVPDFCARCHGDAAFMKKYNPGARVDQLIEYRSSVHGKKNAAGDTVPATCIDCHGAHGIRPVAAPDSPVYATNVPATCARCHADVAKMSPYGIPTTQFDEYRRSVHGAALLERGDTAAPACNDCHGNHGAAPPGVQSVTHVCGQCHGREGALFDASIKKDLFANMNVAPCTTCHDHHLVRHPTPALFHSGSAPRTTKGLVASTDPLVVSLGELAAGETATVEWRVVIRPYLTPDDPRLAHRVEIKAEGIAPVVLDATLRPGESPAIVARASAAADAIAGALTLTPLSGVPVEAGDAIGLRLVVERRAGGPLKDVWVRDLPGAGIDPVAGPACLKCHVPGDACDRATGEMFASVTTLDHELRESAALLRRAEIAGMEVSGPRFELKSKGTTAAVESRALIHAFDPARLAKRAAEGRTVAASALAAGQGALAELQFRRKGLAVSLVLVLLVSVGLLLKIRQVERGRVARGDAPPQA